MNENLQLHTPSVAIVGMSGRFPGANTPQALWDNVCNGKESISFFPAVKDDPKWVNARGTIDNPGFFDPEFFGMSSTEAEITDPQHRIFLECCYEALEDAGYVIGKDKQRVGVYGGCGSNSYFLNHIYPREDVRKKVGEASLYIGNEKDCLTTRVSYKLNLKGPSINVQTACSTALVAVTLACNDLLTHQTDIALAGAMSIQFPQDQGYLYQEGMIYSKDGHCRPFDSAATGTVPSSGGGVVTLKRLEDAIADRDHIYAVIKGYGINNDGKQKMGYSAPSIQGQAEAIEMAIQMAEISPETISYIETHGTGTLLGDPIEIEALTEAYRKYTDKKGYIAIGSLKANIGHLLESAGIAGLIKTALALYYKKLPPSIHFHTPNPHIAFETTPFYVNCKLQEWEESRDHLRRAAVSSFGFGGTNAHFILEEYVYPHREIPDREYAICLSAKTVEALQQMKKTLAQFIKTHSKVPILDIAYTLQFHRQRFLHRFECECKTNEELIVALQKKTIENGSSKHSEVLENGRKVSLPLYPFQRKLYWIDPPIKAAPLQEKKECFPLQQQLLTIWQELLGKSSHPLSEDFFQAGGDSLMAIQFITSLEQNLSISLSIKEFTEHATIEKLLSYLEDRKHVSIMPEEIIQLNNGKTDPPLFMVHPISGYVLCYKPLVEALNGKNAIYGIQPPEAPKEWSIESLAEHYIECMRKIQAKGPYSLLGSSFGGLVAYEMARQLKNQGEKMAFLCMIDIARPDVELTDISNDDQMLQLLIELFTGCPLKEAFTSPAKLKQALIDAMGLKEIPQSLQDEVLRHVQVFTKAITKYRPQTYDGDVLFFEAKEKFFRNKTPSLGQPWKDLIKGHLTVHEIPGNHHTILTQPNIASLASYLKSYFYEKDQR